MVFWCFLGVENKRILESTDIKENFVSNGLKLQLFMPKNTARSGLTFTFSFPVM